MLETDHTFPFTGWTTAIGFWEMVERPPHTRMAGGVEPLQGEQCWASGRAVVGVSDVGEGGLGGRPASGSRRPDIRITQAHTNTNQHTHIHTQTHAQTNTHTQIHTHLHPYIPIKNDLL